MEWYKDWSNHYEDEEEEWDHIENVNCREVKVLRLMEMERRKLLIRDDKGLGINEDLLHATHGRVWWWFSSCGAGLGFVVPT